MSWGQAFGSFAGGLSSGYNTMESVQQRKAGVNSGATPSPDYQTGIERLAARIGIERTEPEQTDPVEEIDAVTADQNAKTWDMIRAQTDSNFTPSQPAQQQSSGGGMQLNPSMMNQFMNGGSGGGGLGGGMGSLGIGGGGGLGGSGLIGSSGGAIPAASNGGASFGLGGSLVGGTGQVGGSTFASGGGAAAGGGGSAAGGIGAGGWWALLAAAIIGNETNAKKKGRRSDNDGQYGLDLLTGKVLEQDAEYYGDKVGGPLGKSMKFGGQMGNPEGVFNAVKKIFK